MGLNAAFFLPLSRDLSTRLELSLKREGFTNEETVEMRIRVEHVLSGFMLKHLSRRSLMLADEESAADFLNQHAEALLDFVSEDENDRAEPYDYFLEFIRSSGRRVYALSYEETMRGDGRALEEEMVVVNKHKRKKVGVDDEDRVAKRRKNNMGMSMDIDGDDQDGDADEDIEQRTMYRRRRSVASGSKKPKVLDNSFCEAFVSWLRDSKGVSSGACYSGWIRQILRSIMEFDGSGYHVLTLDEAPQWLQNQKDNIRKTLNFKSINGRKAAWRYFVAFIMSHSPSAKALTARVDLVDDDDDDNMLDQDYDYDGGRVRRPRSQNQGRVTPAGAHSTTSSTSSTPPKKASSAATTASASTQNTKSFKARNTETRKVILLPSDTTPATKAKASKTGIGNAASTTTADASPVKESPSFKPQYSPPSFGEKVGGISTWIRFRRIISFDDHHLKIWCSRLMIMQQSEDGDDDVMEPEGGEEERAGDGQEDEDDDHAGVQTTTGDAKGACSMGDNNDGNTHSKMSHDSSEDHGEEDRRCRSRSQSQDWQRYDLIIIFLLLILLLLLLLFLHDFPLSSCDKTVSSTRNSCHSTTPAIAPSEGYAVFFFPGHDPPVPALTPMMMMMVVG